MHRYGSSLRMVAVALGLFFTLTNRAAAEPKLVTGSATLWGGVWSFGGDVHVMPDGRTAGSFVITLNHPPYAPIVCTYDQFAEFVVVPWETGKLASFTSTGHCVGEADFGYVDFFSENRFGIVDNGEPGVNADIIDVNGLGAGPWVAIGGVIDGGNFQVRLGD